jgi:hypothetical protein
MAMRVNLLNTLALAALLPWAAMGNNRDELLSGVGKIGADSGAAMRWLVCGRNSFAVVHDGAGAPIIAATQVGRGRIVFLPGRRWLPCAAGEQVADMKRFYENLVQWCGIENSMKAVSNVPDSIDWLEAKGIQAVRSGHPSQFKAGLENAQLVVMELNAGIVSLWPRMLEIVEKGGCIILASNVWNPKDLEKLNAHGRSTGIYFTGQRTSKKDIRGWERYDHFAVKVSTDAANLVNFSTSPAGSLEAAKAIELLGSARGASEIQKKFYPAIKPKLASIKPSLENPVSDPMEKSLLAFEGGYVFDTPGLHTVPHRTALPVGKAPRVTREVAVARAQRQVDTGLYALPGVPVKLSVPPEIIGQKVELKVGHLRTDLKDKEFLMVPNQVFTAPLDSATVELANPYGGLVMLQFPRGAEIAPFKVKIGNVVEAPHFILGKHTDEEWVQSIRSRPTPFGVLETDHVKFIAHSSWLRELDDPTRVLEYWSEMMRLEDEFYNYTGDTLRIHHDFQPVGGFSSFPQSYPVHMELFNYRQLVTSGAPLTMHEHGHHGGKGFMQFTGMSEAVANMGGLYVMANGMDFQWKGSHRPIDRISTFHSLPTDRNMWESGSHSHNQQRYTTFASLAHHFGFETFRHTVHRLKEAGDKSGPHVADNWLRFFSDEAGADLSDFLEMWQISFSDEAKADVAGYPKWQLIEIVEDRIVCKAGEPVRIMRPHLNDFSYDGVLKPGRLSRPERGTLKPDGKDILVYQSEGGFTGTDTFTYEVSNGFGNTYTGTVEIRVLPEADFPEIEFGAVAATSEGWKQIQLKQTFESPVLAVFPVLSAEAGQAVVDVDRTMDGGFKVRLASLEGGKRLSGTVEYMVVEEGVYTKGRHGIKMEATLASVPADGLTPKMDYRQAFLDFYRDPIIFGSVVGGEGNRFVSAVHKRGAHHQVGIVPASGDGGTVQYIVLDSFSSVQIGNHAIYTDRAELAEDFRLASPYPIRHRLIADHAISRHGDVTLLAVASDDGKTLSSLNGLYPADGKTRKPKTFKTHAMMIHTIPAL